jgi:hypothetical protein
MSGDDEEHYFRHRLQKGTVHKDRDAAILELCTSKRVAHVGCVDWPLTSERMADGSLLHTKLMAVATDVVGIDVDQVGLDTMRVSVGGTYVCLDPTHLVDDPGADTPELRDFEPEIVLVGDVVEHVARPQEFLRGIALLASETGSKVIVTTPNSLAFRGTINTLLGYELMHPDHVTVHSPMTLRTLIERSGLRVDRWDYYTIQTGTDIKHRSYDIIARATTKVRSGWADGHLVLASRMPT